MHRPPSPYAYASYVVLALFITLALGSCGLLPPATGDVVPGHWPITGCRMVSGIAGPEDLTIHHGARMAYVSSTDRRAAFADGRPASLDGRLGHIYRLDLDQDPPVVEDVTPPELRRPDFQPHGISLWPRTDGSGRLFIINHRRGAGPDGGDSEEVEVLDVPVRRDGPLVRVRKPISIPAPFVSPNDIAALDGARFYLTSLHGPGSTAGGAARALLGLNDGSVGFYDGANFRTVIEVPFANGIVADLAARRLYVASSADGTIRTFEWEADHPAAPVPGSAPVPLGGRLDNIELDPRSGKLLVAIHPSLRRLVEHRLNLGATPSCVVWLLPARGGNPSQAVEVFANDGNESRPGGVSGASVAALHRAPPGGTDRLLLGSILSYGVLVCDVPQTDREGTNAIAPS